MFVAWKDLWCAKGRFTLMGTVIVLIALLVGLLSGLTAGLGKENTSAVTGLHADRLSFAAPAGDEGVSFTNSRVTEPTWQEWAQEDGVTSADPLGITMTKAEAGGAVQSLAAFGVPPTSALAIHAGFSDTEGDAADGAGPLDSGRVVLSERAAKELGLREGGNFQLGGAEVEVSAVSGEAMYSHAPVVWTSLESWQHLANPASSGSTREPGSFADAGEAGNASGADARELSATVIALNTTRTDGLTATDQRLRTKTVTLEDSLQAIGSHTAENSSLQLMRGFLFVISALVIGAFFTVWTIQRSRDVAVLKALGASTGYVLRDALGQAAVLLLLGTGTGTALSAALGLVVRDTVPYVLEPATVLLPALVMTVLGLLGAALPLRRLTTVDPLTALGSAR